MTTLDAALDYHNRGLPITLCDGKNPLGLSWQNKRWNAGDIRAAYRKNPGLNVGCRWGRDSGMIDLECDSPEAET